MFNYYDNCHVKIYTNQPIGSNPSGSATYDGLAMKLRNRIENEDREIKFALPTSFCASNPALFQPSFAATSYLAVIDDNTGDIQAWFRIMGWGCETDNLGSETFGVEFQFITCIPSNQWCPQLVNQAGLNLFNQYVSSNPLTNSSNELLANNGTPVVNASGNLLATNALKDSSGADGTAGQVLESTGTGTAWTSLPAAASCIEVESGSSEKISAMSAAGSLTGTETVPILQSGSNVTTTLSDICTYCSSGGGPSAVGASSTEPGVSIGVSNWTPTVSPAGLIIVNAYANVLSGSATFVMIVGWMDENNASQSVTYPQLSTTGGTYVQFPTACFSQIGGANIQVSVSVATGSCVFDAGQSYIQLA